MRDHVLRMSAYLVAETAIALFIRWNPTKLLQDMVASLDRLLSWFVAATVMLFIVTCFVLLARRSWGEVRVPIDHKNVREETMSGDFIERSFRALFTDRRYISSFYLFGTILFGILAATLYSIGAHQLIVIGIVAILVIPIHLVGLYPLRNVLWRKSVISVFVLVGLWNLLIASDTVKRASRGTGIWREAIAGSRQVNVHLQLGFYQILSRWRTDPFNPKHLVTLVLIDNKAHWTQLWGDEPTDRSYLAKLITNAAQPTTRASVIVLDVELLVPGKHPAGVDKPERSQANQLLLDAINLATNSGVPVVLPTASVSEGGQQVRLPNIYEDSQLPLQEPDGSCSRHACAVFGYIDAPDDWRRIPLKKRMLDWDKSREREFESLALAAVNAWEGTHRVTRDYPLVKTALRDSTPLFGSFVDESGFDKTPVEQLAAGDPGSKKDCSGRIVLIGGRWHANQGYGSLVDGHFSPVGGFLTCSRPRARFVRSRSTS